MITESMMRGVYLVGLVRAVDIHLILERTAKTQGML